jgi:hypothetical protein
MSKTDASAPITDHTSIGDLGAGVTPGTFNDNATLSRADSAQPLRVSNLIGTGESLMMTNPFPVQEAPRIAQMAPAETPMLNPEIAREVQTAPVLNFSTPADNTGAAPDYKLTVDDQGQVHLQKVGEGDPLADGTLNIEVDPKDKSLEEAIKAADKNLKEHIREMMVLWKQNHPNEPYPSWWENVLNSEPNIPQNTQPTPTERVPRPQNQPPAPQSRPSGGGGGNGGGHGMAGRGGFDNQGYFKGSGRPNEGKIWTGGSDSRGQPIGPGQEADAKVVYDYFIEKGFTPAQASGILGNIQTESSFRTDAYNRNEGAIGICQWLGGRRTNLENFAREQGKPVTDLRVQLDFVMHEFQTSERGAYAAVKAAQTPEQAAHAFQSKYERSAELGPRPANARQWYAKFAGSGPSVA